MWDCESVLQITVAVIYKWLTDPYIFNMRYFPKGNKVLTFKQVKPVNVGNTDMSHK